MEKVLHEAQVEALRRMSLAERLRLTASLWEHARALKLASLRAMHPEWSEAELQDAVKKVLQRSTR